MVGDKIIKSLESYFRRKTNLNGVLRSAFFNFHNFNNERNYFMITIMANFKRIYKLFF